MSPIRIRLAQPNDVESIASNNVLLAKESEEKKISYEQTYCAVTSVLADATKGLYLVAEYQGKIIGQLMITFEWSDWRNENIWWIQSVFVEKRWRRQGIFHQLLNKVYVLGCEKGVHIFRLYVHTSNKAAIAIYRKCLWMQKDYLVFEKTS